MSTGIERGGRGCEGVDMPGVAGGVKAGDIIEGSDPFRACFASGSDSGVSMLSAGVWKSKSSCAAVERWGEKCGGNAVMAVVELQDNEYKRNLLRSKLQAHGKADIGKVTMVCCGVQSLMTYPKPLGCRYFGTAPASEPRQV